MMPDLRAQLGRLAMPFARKRAAQGPAAVTTGAPHIRDAMSVGHAMNHVVVALIPCILMALFNSGYQANLAMAELGAQMAPGWRGAVLHGFGIGYDPTSLLANLWHGALYYVPILAVTWVVGGLWEQLFATVRGRERGPGLKVIALLFSLSLPPSIPLWQVALGISFGIVIAKEVFGGTGKNFLNPALAGLAFLYATYPQQMTGEITWAAMLSITAGGGAEAVSWAGASWMRSFLGAEPGTFGTTSTLACLLGAAYLILKGVASMRVMAGVFFGMIVAVLLFNNLAGDAFAFANLPWHWHLTLGSFAFGMVFLATDPVTAAGTNMGRWVYGILIGGLVVLIRVANVAHPDGVMFAILLGNIIAPLIDYVVMGANIRRRARRHAK